MSAELARIRDELEEEVRARVDAGVCGCGCGALLPETRHKRRRYMNGRHRQRAYQRRLELEAKALGVPARLSLRTLEARDTTNERPSDAQNGGTAPKRRRSAPRPGVSVYLPRPELLELVLEALETAPTGSVQRAGELGDVAEAVTRALERRRRRDERA